MRTFMLDNTSSMQLLVGVAGPVTLPVSTRVVEDIEVTGRAGTLTRVHGWNDVTITIPLLFFGNEKQENHRKLAHLAQSAKTFQLSGEPAGSFRKVKHATLTPLSVESYSWGRAELTLVCQPFRYHQLHTRQLPLTGTMTVVNPGLVEAAPKLIINGTGTVRVTINGITYPVTIASNTITLDSELMTAYIGATAQQNALTLPFPMLRRGSNTFMLPTNSGVTSWRLEVNWRDP